jgi:hypothetical protein
MKKISSVIMSRNGMRNSRGCDLSWQRKGNCVKDCYGSRLLTENLYETEMGERIRKVLVVYGAGRRTAGAKEEGVANFKRKY